MIEFLFWAGIFCYILAVAGIAREKLRESISNKPRLW